MNDPLPIRLLRFAAASVFSLIALLLPYRARALYMNALGFLVHLPYFLFGKLAHYLVKDLDIKFEERR